MMRLKSKLLSLNADKADKDKVKIYSPKNCEELRVPFKADKMAKVVGKLAQIPPSLSLQRRQSSSHPDAMEVDVDDDVHLITGVLVQNDFKMSLMAPEDLREFAGLTTTTITCRQRMTLSAAGIDLIKWALESTFGAIEEVHEQDPSDEPRTNGKAITNGDSNGSSPSPKRNEKDLKPTTVSYLVMGCVLVRYTYTYAARSEIDIEWEGNMLNDGIADAVMAVLYASESSPAAVKRMFFRLLFHICPISIGRPYPSIDISWLRIAQNPTNILITPTTTPANLFKTETNLQRTETSTPTLLPLRDSSDYVSSLKPNSVPRMSFRSSILVGCTLPHPTRTSTTPTLPPLPSPLIKHPIEITRKTRMKIKMQQAQMVLNKPRNKMKTASSKGKTNPQLKPKSKATPQTRTENKNNNNQKSKRSSVDSTVSKSPFPESSSKSTSTLLESGSKTSKSNVPAARLFAIEYKQSLNELLKPLRLSRFLFVIILINS